MTLDQAPPEMRLEEARKAHARGWALTPLRGKKPTLKNWTTLPPPELADIERWARSGNLGVRTGSASGIVVIDDDTPDGSGTAALHLPATPTVITGSGKRHLYFRYPDGGLKNSVGKLGDHVDVRGDGGQVVCVGSLHPDTGRPYTWAPGLSPDDTPLAELPAEIMASLRPPRRGARPSTPGGRMPSTNHDQKRLQTYAKAALRHAIERVAVAAEGTRNQSLNQAAFVLGKYIGGGYLVRSEVELQLESAAERAGLPADEARRTIGSGLRAGEASPHFAMAFAEPMKSNSAPPRTAAPRAVIPVVGGQLAEIVDAAEEALMNDGRDELFQYACSIVRLVRTVDPVVAPGVLRPTGAVAIRLVDATYLVERFTQAAEFVRQRRDDQVTIDCPEKVAKTYLSREGRWRLRKLSGVIEAPTLRPDGSVLDHLGFDESTGLFFDAGLSTFPPVPATPTIDDALRALAQLKHVLKDFPFVAESDRSAMLSALLTATIRRSIRTTPLFTFSAPRPGSGKSLLADLVAMTATGRPCSVMSQGKDEDEQRKRMLAILLDGESVASIDNIERPLGGASLCSVLTQTRFKDRLLGASKTATVSTAITWLATGNNLLIAGDLTSRVIPCDLDPNCEDPEQRRFDLNLHEYVPEHRGALVVAALTILRAYHVAGRPPQALSVFGRFEAWSDWVRSALVWLGEADPCAGRARLQQSDPVSEMLTNVLARWHELLGDASMTVAEVIRRANDPGATAPGEASLIDALNAVAPGKGTERVDAKQLGHWLRRYINRNESGMRIERMATRKNIARWRVVQVCGTGTAGVGSAGLAGSSATVPGDLAAEQQNDPDGEATETASDPPETIPPIPQIPPDGPASPGTLREDDWVTL